MGKLFASISYGVTCYLRFIQTINRTANVITTNAATPPAIAMTGISLVCLLTVL